MLMSEHPTLNALVGMLIPWYCGRSLHQLLSHVNVHELSEAQLADLEEFDFHHFPEIPYRSITFVMGTHAVEIIRGVRDGRWTREEVLAALPAPA